MLFKDITKELTSFCENKKIYCLNSKRALKNTELYSITRYSFYIRSHNNRFIVSDNDREIVTLALTMPQIQLTYTTIDNLAKVFLDSSVESLEIYYYESANISYPLSLVNFSFGYCKSLMLYNKV